VAAAMLVGCGGSQMPVAFDAGTKDATTTVSVENPTYEVSDDLLYITNFDPGTPYDDVKIYHAKAKNPSPFAVITSGISYPTGDCIDGNGTLYVSNEPPSGPGWVSEYPLGKLKASIVITKGINTPGFCAIDGLGDLWVTNIDGPSVTEYKQGSKKPLRTITNGLTYPVGIAIDHSGNLYVSNRPSQYYGNVVVYGPGKKFPSRTITDGVTSPAGIAVDAEGSLYVSNLFENNVEKYLAGQSDPYESITDGVNDAVDVTANKKGRLFVTNYGNNIVVEFPPNSTTPSGPQISKGLYTPASSAYYPALIP